MLDFTLAEWAENDLAGCLLVEPAETIRCVDGLVSASDFQSGTARAIFNAAASLIHAGKSADPVLIQAEAARTGCQLDASQCAELMQRYVTTANAAETARLIHEAAQERRGREIGLLLAGGDLTPVAAHGRLQELLLADSGSVLSPQEAAQRYMDELSTAAAGRSKPFLSTGFISLDRQLSGGLAAGGLITLAARPGTGKTTVALNIAENVAAAGGKVLYISLEMTERQLWDCRVAMASGLSRSQLAAGAIPENDADKWRRAWDAVELLYDRPFFIRDLPSTMEDIEREARSIEGLALLVVDHIGLIKPTAAGSRYELMTAASHALKQLALSLKKPILALCQLNRQSEARESKRPTMADLRDSGAIEEDSDAVLLLFREAVYSPEEQRPKPWEEQTLDVLIDKNRYGTTGRVTLGFYGITSRIVECQNWHEGGK